MAAAAAQCPICGGQFPARPHVKLPGLVLSRCAGCDLLYRSDEHLPPADDWSDTRRRFAAGELTAEQFDVKYRERFVARASLQGSYASHFDNYDDVHDEMLQRVEVWAGLDGIEHPRVVEIGGADGRLLLRILQRWPGAEVTLVEPSPLRCDDARSLGLERVHCGTLDDAGLPVQYFDAAIIFGNLMLHPDFVRTLSLAEVALRPGGRLLFDVKSHGTVVRKLAVLLAKLPGPAKLSVRYPGLAFRGPRVFLSRKSVALALAKVGLKAVHVSTADPRSLTHHSRTYRPFAAAVVRVLALIDGLRDRRPWIFVVAEKG